MYLWMTIYILPRELSTGVAILLATSYAEINSSSHELTSPVSNSVYGKKIQAQNPSLTSTNDG